MWRAGETEYSAVAIDDLQTARKEEEEEEEKERDKEKEHVAIENQGLGFS